MRSYSNLTALAFGSASVLVFVRKCTANVSAALGVTSRIAAVIVNVIRLSYVTAFVTYFIAGVIVSMLFGYSYCTAEVTFIITSTVVGMLASRHGVKVKIRIC